MSDMFGDIEPEDAWDADDPVREQLRNIARRVALIVAAAELSARHQLRIEQIAEDLAHVIGRLGDDD